MNLLADCDVNGLKNMIERLMKVEIERMKQFNIFFEKTSDKINSVSNVDVRHRKR